MVNAKENLETKDVDKAAGPSTQAAADKDSAPLNVSQQLQRNLALLEQAVALKELRLISGRLQRQTAAIRRELTAPVLQQFVQEALPQGMPTREQLLQCLHKVHLHRLLHRLQPAPAVCFLNLLLSCVHCSPCQMPAASTAPCYRHAHAA